MPNINFSTLLQPFVDDNVLAGAVTVVATKVAILHHDAVGFADIAARKPMTKDALFWIASQTKPMTATALMMLVDEGKVHVNDPVEKYLPEFAGQMVIAEKDDEHVLLRRPHHPIKVREVLCHTAGLPFKSPMEEPTVDGLTVGLAVKSNAIRPLLHEPGTKYEYSNAGTNTAGRIIEVVSGMAYEKFLQERLLGPLGMKETTFWPDEGQALRLAKSYKPGPDNTGLEETTISQLAYPLTDRSGRYPVPAGGLFSTALDCARFCQMILNGGELDGRRYVSAAAVKQMTSKQTGDTIENGYGFGWQTEKGLIAHGGAHATYMFIDPKTERIGVVLSQHAGFAGESKIHETFVQAVISSS